MMKTIATAFIQHPAKVGESYWQHFAVAARFGVTLFKAAGAALVHALFPFLCEHTASDTIMALHREMSARRGHTGG